MDEKEGAQIVRKMAEHGELREALETLCRFPLPATVRNLVSSMLFRINKTNENYINGLIDHREAQENDSRNALQLFEVLTEIEQGRLEVFFGHMTGLKFSLNDELATNPEFVHAFSQTLNVVLHTNRKEKVLYLANLLMDGFRPGSAAEPDQYEFYLRALDNLTFIEIQILALLHDFETRTVGNVPNDYVRLAQMAENWTGFLARAKGELSLDQDECEAYLLGIEKSGMINFQKQGLRSTKKYGACTTVLFRRLYDKIMDSHTINI